MGHIEATPAAERDAGNFVVSWFEDTAAELQIGLAKIPRIEATPLNTSFYKEALIVLGAAGIVIPLFHRLHVSPVLGFMLIGLAVGPFGLASLAPNLSWLSAITISTPESIEPIARLGVVLLLFMIGLELSFERLWVMRRLVFGLGFLQVVVCATVLAGAAVLLGHSRISAAVIGLALALSSTAVVIQVLSEEKRLNTASGRSSFAILLFQDLAVVPVLLAILLIHEGGHVFALDNRCPHMGFPLERGSFEDGILTCHWHHARFELASGCTFDLWADDSPTCPVEIRAGGEIWVKPLFGDADPVGHWRRRLADGLAHNLNLVIAKAVHGQLAAGLSSSDVVRQAALFGTGNRDG